MKTISLVIIVLALAGNFGFSKTEPADTPRAIISLDADWRFHLSEPKPLD